VNHFESFTKATKKNYSMVGFYGGFDRSVKRRITIINRNINTMGEMSKGQVEDDNLFNEYIPLS
jgi:hypothetical protein